MKKSFYLPIISLLFILAGVSLFWFKDIRLAAINPDEVVWVLDARFYEFRKNKNWAKFSLQNNEDLSGWTSDHFRLLDQPQSGKYWYGWLLDIKNLSPWEAQRTQFLYQGFASSSLDWNIIKTQTQYQSMLASIQWLRIIGTTISFLSIGFWGWGVFRLTKSKIGGALASLTLLLHPTLSYLYKRAVPNSLQIFFTLSSLGLIYYLLGKIRMRLSWKNISGWFLAGFLAAVSASIKLNGFFIVLIPIFVWFCEEIRACFKKDGATLANLKSKAISFLFFAGSFFATVYWLEPELWRQPIAGIYALFQSRLTQHHRFQQVFANYSIVETWWFLSSHFFELTKLFWLKIVLLFVVLRGIKITVSRAFVNKRRYQLSSILLFILITSSFYANVGFDRYAEWSIFIFSFLFAVGGIEFLKIIYQKIHCL